MSGVVVVVVVVVASCAPLLLVLLLLHLEHQEGPTGIYVLGGLSNATRSSLIFPNPPPRPSPRGPQGVE
jgi:hypothetical protein